MHKQLIYLLPILLFSLLNYPISHYAQKEDYRIFPIGSVISEDSDGSYHISTEGQKPLEGYVFTITPTGISNHIQLSVNLKGNASLIIKAVETNVKGKYLKETASPTVTLSPTWTTYQLDFSLDQVTTQIDLFDCNKRKTENKLF